MAENNKSQSPPSDTVEWRRENYDNTAFTRSKCYSCNNSPNTLVKLRSKHHYLYTEACLRWYVVEFILTKIKLFLSSPETNKQLQSKPVAEVRMYPRTCRVSSPRHLTAFTMSCTRGCWKLYGKLLFLCLFVCFFLLLLQTGPVVWNLAPAKCPSLVLFLRWSLFPPVMINHRLKQASFLLNVKQFLLYNLLSDQSKHDLSPLTVHHRAIPVTRERREGEENTHLALLSRCDHVF